MRDKGAFSIPRGSFMDGGVWNTPLLDIFLSSNCIYFTSFVVSLFYSLASQVFPSTPWMSGEVDTEAFWLSGSIFLAYSLTTIHDHTIPCLNRAPSNRPITRTLPSFRIDQHKTRLSDATRSRQQPSHGQVICTWPLDTAIFQISWSENPWPHMRITRASHFSSSTSSY